MFLQDMLLPVFIVKLPIYILYFQFCKSSVKSLISFAHRIGYLAFDVGRPVKLTAAKDTLAERILSESEIHRIIEAEPMPRNKLLLKMLYCTAVRVSELSYLCFRVDSCLCFMVC